MKPKFTTAAALGLLMLASPAFGQQGEPGPGGQRATEPGQQTTRQQQQQQQGQQQASPDSWLTASKLNGADVKNQQQESVGTISELIIDPENARVVFGVVETRNFLGLNQKKYLIPWKTFQVDRNLEEAGAVALTLDATREKLEKSFEYQEDQMASINPQEIYSYWGEDFSKFQSQTQTKMQGQQQSGQQQPQQPRQQQQQPGQAPMREREVTPDRPGTGIPGNP